MTPAAGIFDPRLMRRLQTSDVKSATALLAPLSREVGVPLPLTRYRSTGKSAGLHVHRCSCCLLYLAPAQDLCGSCPRRRSRAGGRHTR